MKTAVTVLQEMMVKMGKTPDYECISQSGPQHQAMFEYRCAALGATVTAAARSKKEAKQEAGRLMLLRLAQLGHPVPPPYGLLSQAGGSGVCGAGVGAGAGAGDASGAGAGEAGGGGGARSYVALLKEFAEEYRLPAPDYELVGDTGPPHLRHFTVVARVGSHERAATATTKKAARQLAADQLYSYLRENLSRFTNDFVEEAALARAHEKAMERYRETRDERRPDLGQRVADFHLGLLQGREPESLLTAKSALEAGDGGLEAALAALGLEATASTLDTDNGPLFVVQIEGSSPALAFAGYDAAAARARAARYLRRTLAPAAPAPPAPATAPAPAPALASAR